MSDKVTDWMSNRLTWCVTDSLFEFKAINERRAWVKAACIVRNGRSKLFFAFQEPHHLNMGYGDDMCLIIYTYSLEFKLYEELVAAIFYVIS